MDETTLEADPDPYAGLLHDLRGPVTSIQSYVRMLMARDGDLSSAARATIHQVILQQSQRLDTVIDDMVLYVRLLTGGVSVEEEPVLLSALLEEVRQLLGEPARVFTGSGTDVVLHTDREALAGALRRLTRNALVFGPRQAAVQITASTPEDGWVTIRVSDSGLGIPASAVELAMQPFVRAVRPGERRADGLGLGLAVVRELAVLMRGELLLSNTNPGLTAALRLPC